MKPVAFDYHRPDTIIEAVALLDDMKEQADVLAGGMTLGPMLNMRLVRPRAVVDITRIEALRSISIRGNMIVTGACVVQREALRSDLVARELPLLALALPWVGHFQTRNRGTLGGSVAHADPSAEIPLALVVSGGTVVLRSRRGERRIPAREFFLGALATARRPDEMIVALEWPRTPPDTGCAFAEIAQRHGDFAIVAAACCTRIDADGRLQALSFGLGGVESKPVALDVRRFIDEPAASVAGDLPGLAAAAVTPMDDRNASAEYRLALTKVLTARVFGDALSRAANSQGLAS
jgi:2-furoyl-CoA dehydrogenase FAD binding subunit